MSTLEVNKITPVSGGTTVQVGESGDTINIPAGATIANAGTSTGFGDSLRPNAQNLIINSDMAVAQRGTSFSHPDTNNDAYPVDRFSFLTGSIGAYTSTQETLSSGAAYDAGFRKAARIDCTTAQASPAAGDYFLFQYKMEAQDCMLFKKGTSNAEKMTVAFWVKSNKTGTSQLTVKDGDNDRICAGTYAISSANTWEHKVINIAADTTGAFNNDNGAGFIFEWWLGGGSSYTSGTAPTAWEARTDADRGANNLSINDNTANDWAITGIQVEVGEYTSSTIPPFQHESLGDNLIRCYRYYEHTGSEGNTMVASGQTTGNTTMVCHLHYHPKRAAPSITLGTALTTNQHNGVAGNVTTKSTSNIRTTDCEFRITHDAGTANFAIAQGMSNVVINNTGQGLEINAEL